MEVKRIAGGDGRFLHAGMGNSDAFSCEMRQVFQCGKSRRGKVAGIRGLEQSSQEKEYEGSPASVDMH